MKPCNTCGFMFGIGQHYCANCGTRCGKGANYESDRTLMDEMAACLKIMHQFVDGNIFVRGTNIRVENILTRYDKIKKEE